MHGVWALQPLPQSGGRSGDCFCPRWDRENGKTVLTKTCPVPSESGTRGGAVEEGSGCGHLRQGRTSSTQGRQLSPAQYRGIGMCSIPFTLVLR